MLFKLTLIVILLSSGTAWSEPCADEGSCLALKEELTKELDAVESRLKTFKLANAVESKEDFWISLDLGLGVIDGLYTSVGVTIPLGPVHLSPGVWFGNTYEGLGTAPQRGLYLALGKSWMLWE